ncbi:hypothetical protein H920_10341 [Fukomys damarensis]|uniref:Calponin-homology (CH) domain-containing protein n=1 Tax=Fukomys damarensis TaxID=885580 RepID=A0A091DDC7_FUKDA|nr:hypothetical protein H920_10341 [Fukomys damarensis]
MYLKNNSVCYRMLCLIGEIKSPKIRFDPPFIFFTPVPLDVTTVMDVKILPQNYFSTQGGCVSHIMPEFLLEPRDYKKWLEISPSTSTMSMDWYTANGKCPFTIDMNKFEACSKRAWTDIFLQIYKVLVLSRVLPQFSNAAPPIKVQNTQKISPYFVSSNIYSDSERILLSWLNTNYENTRHIIWGNRHKGAVPSERWIVNFDKDLLDGLVFATQLAAYCPFLIESHFVNMYTKPKRPEQYLHNCLIIISSFDDIGLDMSIQVGSFKSQYYIHFMSFFILLFVHKF